MFHGMNTHGWGMGWGWLIGLIILVGILLIVVKMVQANNGVSGNTKTPLDILKERYAKGEIDKQEFDERKKDL
ncbi:MAG: SHOCT domain-containing protein [Fibrobacterota bacterium]